MSSGYSGTPLVQKLGIKPGDRVAFLAAPAHYGRLLGDLPDGARVLARPGRRMDFVQLFVSWRAQLLRRLPGLVRSLAPSGMLWISWPKKTSRLDKDIAEGDVRAAGLAAGLVDVKICAVDEDWSGLKFVVRLADRDVWPGRGT